MIKDITVYLDGTAADTPRLAHAAALCQRFDAHLTGLYLNILPQMIIASAEAAYPVELVSELETDALRVGDEVTPTLTEKITRAANRAELRRHDIYRSQAAEVVASQARACDLLVTTAPHASSANEIDPLVVEAALFDAGRGTLIVPPNEATDATFKKVLIGWRNSREAARAVAEAMPFLAEADHVVLAMVDEDGAPAQKGVEPAADMARHLDRHGVAVEIRHLSKWDRTEEALVNEAKAIGADLMVVGAYGHSRLREWAIGGTTRGLLTSAPMPVLMAH